MSECPFELPVKANEELLMLHINGELRASMIIGDVDDWNNEKRLLYLRYIVQAINSHEKLVELLRYPYNLPMNEAGDYDENVEWIKKVEQALKEAEKE